MSLNRLGLFSFDVVKLVYNCMEAVDFTRRLLDRIGFNL